MVTASGWRLFDRQIEPYLRALTAAPLRCGLGCLQYNDPDIFFVSVVNIEVNRAKQAIIFERKIWS
jgi:hypothetical protein